MGVPPSGKTVSLTGMAFLRAKDSRIAETWDEWNRLAFMKQAGIPLS
jgi:predicted ester cyclase